MAGIVVLYDRKKMVANNEFMLQIVSSPSQSVSVLNAEENANYNIPIYTYKIGNISVKTQWATEGSVLDDAVPGLGGALKFATGGFGTNISVLPKLWQGAADFSFSIDFSMNAKDYLSSDNLSLYFEQLQKIATSPTKFREMLLGGIGITTSSAPPVVDIITPNFVSLMMVCTDLSFNLQQPFNRMNGYEFVQGSMTFESFIIPSFGKTPGNTVYIGARADKYVTIMQKDL